MFQASRPPQTGVRKKKFSQLTVCTILTVKPKGLKLRAKEVFVPSMDDDRAHWSGVSSPLVMPLRRPITNIIHVDSIKFHADLH